MPQIAKKILNRCYNNIPIVTSEAASYKLKEGHCMVTGMNFVPNMQIQGQSWQSKTDTPVIASIKVGDVTDSAQLDKPEANDNFLQKLRNYFINKRRQKLESIPPEKRTASQQAEIEANKKSVDYML